MKVKEMIAFEAGTVRVTLESEHPAELAMIRLMNGCEAACETKVPKVHPEQNASPLTKQVRPDPELQITVTVKKNTVRGY